MDLQPTVKKHLEQLQRYCAYRDRCHSEVEKKMTELSIYDEDERFYLTRQLVDEQFLDEQRFTNSYVRGHYKLKKWGKKKIEQGLKQKDISDFCIRKAFEKEIDETLYSKNVDSLAKQKIITIERTTSDIFQRREKLQRFLMGKGYSFSEIQNALEDYTPLR